MELIEQVEKWDYIRRIIHNYNGDSFEEKFNNYMKTAQCVTPYEISREIKSLFRKTLVRILDLVPRTETFLGLFDFSLPGETIAVFFHLVIAFDEFKYKHNDYTPYDLYMHIERVISFPLSNESNLYFHFKSKWKRNMMRLLIVCLSDLREDFGSSVSGVELIDYISSSNLVYLNTRSYYHLLVESQMILDYKAGQSKIYS